MIEIVAIIVLYGVGTWYLAKRITAIKTIEDVIRYLGEEE